MKRFALDNYTAIYDGLSEVREIFHRDGRLSDSNQKLDETLKILSIHYCAENGIIDQSLYAKCKHRESFAVAKLQTLFDQVLDSSAFRTADGLSLFENSNSIAFTEQDVELAFELFNTLTFAELGIAPHKRKIDVLNEAFGHYVRDNFRSNTEDAQYMTPPEVVDFMVSIGRSLVSIPDNRPLVVMDPSSGVGSFLATFHNQVGAESNVTYVAQDKVARMARLTAANFVFSNASGHEVHIGNSIYDGSPIDKWNGQVDMILTNPPFGAKFPSEDVAEKCKISAPIFAAAAGAFSNIDSELIFIDRYLTLLREGGVCLAVVPDGVISAKGAAAFTRSALSERAEILGIVELPAVTFAQAGTRTKTSILVFRKSSKPKTQSEVFLAEATSLGFEVVRRKGVQHKRLEGVNQLAAILENWHKRGTHNSSGTWISVDFSRSDAWTPRTLLFQDKIANNNERIGTTVSLRDLVRPLVKRKSKKYEEGCYFISILHVIGEGLLDISAMKGYRPITPGIEIKPGNVIVSRLNPRIPRVLVVPELPGRIICSTEFEVLEPQDGVNPYELAYALLTPFAQEQLQSLTAGTSASHARIKPGKMLDVQVPWASSHDKDEMQRHTEDLQAIFQHMWRISERRDAIDAA